MIHLLDNALPGHTACCKVPLNELDAVGDEAVPDKKAGQVNCPQYGWSGALESDG
ncbi:hypothetical protein [Kribbella sp. NPDC051718]|uniref:hypothetical protein n=1 Tax=Kribbella sp. NPDC051718 TaxID=3155168 RepID=UPI00342650E3